MNRPLHRSIVVSARVFLGAVFIYLGAVKAADPVTFLKLVRAFGVVASAPSLNLVAAILPWLEIFCGVLLVLGLKARAAALLQAGLLVGFTALVTLRAVAIHQAGGVPFCAIRFDCGCGTGEVLICMKLLENLGLITLALFVLDQHRPEVSRTPGTEAHPTKP